MSKVDRTFEQPNLIGIERRLRAQNQNSAWVAENWRYDARLMAFINDRGWVPYNEELNVTATSNFVEGEVVWSVYAWEKNGGSERYIIYETPTAIKYIKNQNNVGTILTKPLEVQQEYGINNRSLTDPGVQYIDAGNYVIIFNIPGNRALKFFNRDRIEPFGYVVQPPPPTPITPSRVSMGKVDASSAYTWAFTTTDEDTGTYSVGVWGYGNSAGMDPGAQFGDLTDDAKGSAIQTNLLHNLKCSYKYKIAYVSDTGSESPASEGSKLISWLGQMDGDGGDDANEETFNLSSSRFFLPITNIPIGPEGTLTRRIYRTKNLNLFSIDPASAPAEETFYFVDEIPNNCETFYLDMASDVNLASEMPTINETGTMPVDTKFATLWGNKLVLAGGIDSTAIYYSESGRFEQFGNDNYYNISGYGVGDITGIFPSANILYIFARRGIFALIPDEQGGFYLTTISDSIGCIAHKSIQFVPGTGVVFLGQNGFYAISGNPQYDQVKILSISDGLGGYLDNTNLINCQIAASTYNAKDQEYWCSLPTDGFNDPMTGFVYHAPIKTWTIRQEVPATSFTQLPEGFTLFGSNYETTIANLTGYEDNAINYAVNNGLQLWCGRPTWGIKVTGSAEDPTYAERKPPNTRFATAWLDFGDDDYKKEVLSVEFDYLETGGQAKPQLNCFIDYDRYPIEYSAGTVSTMIRNPERQPYGSFYLTQTQAGSATFDKANAAGPTRMLTVRYDVAPLHAVSFQFQIETTTTNAASLVLDEKGDSITPALNLGMKVCVLGYKVNYRYKGELKTYQAKFNQMANSRGGTY